MRALVVGSGISGSTIARVLADNGAEVTVLDRNNHVGGNIYDTEYNGYYVHEYGPHIWHNSDDKVQEFVERFTEFIDYQHNVAQSTDIGLLNYPIDFESCKNIYSITSKEELDAIIESDKISNPSNMEEAAISKIGKKAYELYIENYTKRQWGYHPRELDKSLANRIGVNFSEKSGLFAHEKYTGMPKLGYTHMIKKMLDDKNIKVILNAEFLSDMYLDYDVVVYTGCVSELFNDALGELPYICVEFEEILTKDWKVKESVLNISKFDSKINRLSNYANFGYEVENPNLNYVTMAEHPGETGVKCYPITVKDKEANTELYHRYLGLLADNLPNLVVAGRLGLYEYLDMNKAVASSLEIADSILKGVANYEKSR